MKKTKVRFVCQSCEYSTPKWLGRCPQCNEYNTFVEDIVQQEGRYEAKRITNGIKPILLKDIKPKDEPRIKTNIGEFDRATGGGIVNGSVLLLGGDPGIGKSTLTLQISKELAENNHKVLYVSAEESATQISLRAKRLSVPENENIYIMCETQLDTIRSAITTINPTLVIIDSIQMLYKPEIPSAPGMITQVRECASYLVHDAKSTNVSMIIIGHITKEGAIAGPKSLEHLVDAVFYLEGDKYQSFRILRAIKNRYGSTAEIAIFDMTREGLKEVSNPSGLLISENRTGRTGSIITAPIIGSRVLLSEIQCLTSPCHAGFPTRRVTGLDYQRIHQLLAVLDARYGISLANYDVFVNVVGGVKIEETSCDLPTIISTVSSLKKRTVDPEVCAFGEVGLSGEVRSVSQINIRLNEASRLGFKKIIAPTGNKKEVNKGIDAKIMYVSHAIEAIDSTC